MAKQEQFVVRTSVPLPGGRKFAYRTTIANGRPEAVRQVERIGPIDAEDRPLLRDFLEGKMGDRSGSTHVMSKGDDGLAIGVGIIFQVTE
jgi:hypothetical protein